MRTGCAWSLDRRAAVMRQLRVIVLDFLETDIFNLSVENCVRRSSSRCLNRGISISRRLGLEVVLNRRLVPEHRKRFEFVEREHPFPEERGLRAFLGDPSLSGDATAEEIDFLRTLRFTRTRPTALYYYRELQSLRDPLHFGAARG